MNLNQLLNDLCEKYSFQNPHFQTDEQSPNLLVSLTLTEEHIEKFIQKAGHLNSLVDSCADMVSIFDDTIPKEILKQTSLHCTGSNQLTIRTTPSMLKILIETLFD
jgi:hypothetical protein